ncbi:hypothetical protein Pmani_024202 [Petrolisthes manimaculis]|uniref:Bestrophin homolog n=1 Tax=Petrolisthes manimaculis TaxID=1843537 RepID=A0AAE1PAU9_9EUCA|nr:hypothetical protein Pmani_024202 [Petrolisthes manimaculis]
MPISWACRAVQRARQQGLVTTDLGYKELVEEILKIRRKCGGLIGYDSNNIPLVYCQVVSIAVYSYFLFSVLGEQFLDPTQGYPDHNIDLYFPVFGFLQLFFYLGWMKVAEALLNPFGADDHDFDFISLLKRHSKLSALLCDPSPEDYPSRLYRHEKPRPLPIFFTDDDHNNDNDGNKKKTPCGTSSSSSCCRVLLRRRRCCSSSCSSCCCDTLSGGGGGGMEENALQLQQAEERDSEGITVNMKIK